MKAFIVISKKQHFVVFCLQWFSNILVEGRQQKTKNKNSWALHNWASCLLSLFKEKRRHHLAIGLHRQLGFTSDSRHLTSHISWFFLLPMVGLVTPRKVTLCFFVVILLHSDPRQLSGPCENNHSENNHNGKSFSFVSSFSLSAPSPSIYPGTKLQVLII